MTRALALPRNTTRQADQALLGNVARLLHRASGVIVVAFVLVHVVVQAVRHVPALAGMHAAAPWLEPLQRQDAVHAILYASVLFHTLYGLRLLAGDLGLRLDYRLSLVAVLAASALPFLYFAGRHVLG